STPLRVAHYVNQFCAGIGGEEHAGVGVSVREEPVGPGRALQAALGEGARVVATIVCGDNFISERRDEALAAVRAALERIRPDVLIAGPAFGSGRYGLACGEVCVAAQSLGVPALAAMHPEHPGVESFRRFVVIVPTAASATGMNAALERVVPLALRLARKETLGPAEIEGYLSQGRRVVHDRGRPGYQRALDMLLAKLHGQPYVTEVPFRA